MKINVTTLALFFITMLLSSCQAIGDIFKTGVWFGVIGVIAIILLIIYFVTRASK
jgi:hypothetical protein